MKKILALLIAVGLLLSACSPTSSTAGSESSFLISSSSSSEIQSSEIQSSSSSRSVSSELLPESSSQSQPSLPASPSSSSKASSTPTSSIPPSSSAPPASSAPASSQQVSSIPLASPSDFTAISPSSYYAYNQLNKNQQKVYNALVKGIEEMKTRIDLSSFQVTTDEFSVVLNHYQDDYPQHFWISGNYECYYIGNYVTGVKPVYACTAEEKASMQKKIDKEIENILSGAPAKASHYEMELYLHDWLVKNVDYDQSVSGSNIYDIYGALVDKKAVCEGYAKAFQHLLRTCGIQSLMISGYLEDQNHAWNMVLLDNDFYHVDVTWDDPVNSDGTPNTTVYHSYFNLTADQIKENHVFYQNSFSIPAAASLQYNYFVVENAVIGSLSGENETKILNVIKKALSQGNRYFEFRVSGDYESFKAQYLKNWAISPLIQKAAGEVGTAVQEKYSYGQSAPSVVTVYLNY